jgi:hypothetical protein
LEIKKNLPAIRAGILCRVVTYFPKLEYVHKWVKWNFKVAKYISVLPNNYCLILSTELSIPYPTSVSEG